MGSDDFFTKKKQPVDKVIYKPMYELKLLRRKQGLRVEDLARLLELSVHKIRLIERGKYLPEEDLLFKIKDAVGISNVFELKPKARINYILCEDEELCFKARYENYVIIIVRYNGKYGYRIKADSGEEYFDDEKYSTAKLAQWYAEKWVESRLDDI